MSLARKGLRCLKDLYVDGSFTSFNQLLANFGLNNSDFFRYFQLRDFVRTHSPTFPQIPPTTGTDHILLADTSTKGFVSYLYDHLLPTKESIIDSSIWGKALETIKSSSSWARLSLIEFKVLHRFHYSKAKLSTIYPGTVEDRYHRCSLSPRKLTHMFWTCPKMLRFWESFFKVISEITQIHIPPSPQVAIFGRLSDDNVTPNIQPSVIAFTSLIARRRIRLLWKSHLPSSSKSWLCDIMSFLEMEKSILTGDHWSVILNSYLRVKFQSSG